MRMIDKDALIEWFKKCHFTKASIEAIELFKEEDAVPVVRCEDCKHYDAENGDCEEICHLVGDEDYCSYGSRKDGEHDDNG